MPPSGRPGRLPALPHSAALRAGSILYYNNRIIYKQAVALKALNPRDIKQKDIICYNFFGVDPFFKIAWPENIRIS